MKREELAKIIDHTMLNPEATALKVKKFCQEAVTYGFGCVVVHPCWVSLAYKELEDTDVKVGTVCGFPFGANKTRTKVAEATVAIEEGASDIDMVLNIGWLKEGLYDHVKEEIYQVVTAVKQLSKNLKPVVKVIIETCLLTDAEKVTAAQLIKAAGADFVKTSTGYLGPGANIHDVGLLRRAVGPEFGIKASGGIRTLAAVRDLIAAGANRIGTSAAVKIIQEMS